MDILYSALVFLHMIGLAGIIAGFLMQVITDNPKSTKVLLHSSLLQLVTGLLLVGVAEMADLGELNHVKIAVKLLVALAVVVVGVLNLRKPARNLAVIAGVLAIVNIGVAVFW
ncbi:MULTISPECIES: hypothetical protein [Nocardiopsis]|uniref:Integral membrane protein n=1 Tax=Nocardiopsis dassonvillei (strain ATCC 23218 / DSM 43111 / CIP 107115 / JCM 7437 / KCTC 9190 / NBRC 14626 / NCTC 10488 / NRRL B-5397 / IMRU 509) TaxID=446468 RepID=D7B0G6_NOCDD|nr:MULTISPECIES: hypothetical protein [Nocardiopsis]ADH66373.1 conserved hypothetical protein [Nocardiopsis dassonvillei subsp. dassonvillei DSM 43111]APC34691.1 hypothetical protein A9R04_08280 [Nocardiopsis dassonvillei]NKY82325.1 hypothetical protein [Nocardiopsis dassonvillei]VEI92394.1 Uncharacterised protein [Nocardiopsis dassonvillei]